MINLQDHPAVKNYLGPMLVSFCYEVDSVIIVNALLSLTIA